MLVSGDISILWTSLEKNLTHHTIYAISLSNPRWIGTSGSEEPLLISFRRGSFWAAITSIYLLTRQYWCSTPTSTISQFSFDFSKKVFALKSQSLSSINSAFVNFTNKDDPAGQFAFMESEMKSAMLCRKNGTTYCSPTVHIVAHIAPGGKALHFIRRIESKTKDVFILIIHIGLITFSTSRMVNTHISLAERWWRSRQKAWHCVALRLFFVLLPDFPNLLSVRSRWCGTRSAWEQQNTELLVHLPLQSRRRSGHLNSAHKILWKPKVRHVSKRTWLMPTSTFLIIFGRILLVVY